jgi:ketosteroid isomerase-like protein
MALQGKGLYIWKVHRCEGGNSAAIVRRAREAGLTHVLIKIADGPRAYNVDLAAPVVEALQAAGLQAWGWQFAYGDEPFGEADIAVHRMNTLKLDGFVVNAETAYKGKHAAARAYMESLRGRLPDALIALSSFRYPRIHPELPWTEFLTDCNYNMPQVYWLQAHNPAEQLERCVEQFQQVYPVRPIIPTGAAYFEFGWQPSPNEVTRFLQKSRELGLSAANFWSWDYAGNEGRDLWDAIAAFDWPVEEPPRDIIERYVNRLNNGRSDKVVKLYQPDAVHVTPERIIQGHDALLEYYTDLLSNKLPDATFTLETLVSEGYVRHFRWDAASPNGMRVVDGRDTVALRQGKIQYHSSVYKITE